MRITEQLNADIEIKKLKEQLYNITGQNLDFNYDCYLGIDDYKEHIQECVKAGKIIVRSQDEKAAHRFDSVFSK